MMITNKLFHGYWIILVAFAAMFLSSGLIFYGFSVLNKPIGDEFSWGRGEVTAAYTIFSLAMAAVSPIVGRFTDKYGPRKILILGAIVISLVFVLLSRTSALWDFYLLHLCLGIGFALLGPIPVSVIISNWFYRLKSTMQGVAFSGAGWGGLALAPLIGNYLVPNLGWRGTYMAMALLLVVIMLPLAIFLAKDNPHQKGLRPYGQKAVEVSDDSGSKIEAVTGLSVKEAAMTTTFWIVVLTFVVYGLASTGALQNQVSILSEQGFAIADVVVAIGIIGLLSAVGKFIFGYLCDHLDPKYPTAISYITTVCALVTMIFARSIAHLRLYAVFMGLTHAGWASNLAMLAARYFGLKHYGAVLGAMYLVYSVGDATGPMIIGFTYDQTGSYWPILTLLAILCAISIPIITIIRTPKTVSG